MHARTAKRIEEQTRIDSRQSHLSKVALSIVIVVCLGSASWAQMPVGNALTSFLSGQVTAVHDKTLQIDNKNYEIRPDATVKDDEGHPMELSSIVSGAEVKFLLKQGRIEQIVVTLPK